MKLSGGKSEDKPLRFPIVRSTSWELGTCRYGQLLRKGTVVKPMMDDDDDEVAHLNQNVPRMWQDRRTGVWMYDI